MIFVEIPGRDNLNIKNIVFDYNGTVAEDGIIATQTKENLKKISEKLKGIHNNCRYLWKC